MSEKKAKRVNMVLQNYVENGVPWLKLDLSDVIVVSCYRTNEELCVLELEFSLLDDVQIMLINFLSTEKALELYNFILENAKNLVRYESEF